MSRDRHHARRYAVQAIYQWQMAGQDVADILGQFLAEHRERKFERAYFEELVRGVATNTTTLDEAIEPLLSRPISQVDPVERAILRLAAHELKTHPEVPYRVVINEAVELAKTFGAEQGHRFVNGVLDKLAPMLREVEVKTRRSS